MICDYGCGKEAIYQLSNGKWCCSETYQKCSYIRNKNSEGVKRFNKNTGRDYKIQYKRISDEKKKNMNWSKGLNYNNNESIKKQVDNRIKSFNEGKWKGPWNNKRHTITEIDKIVCSMNNRKTNNSIKYKKGWKYNIFCDSRLELAFVIYHIENGDKLERNLKGYDYIYNNKKHRYYPDFRLNGKLVEIKGYYDKINDIKLKSVDEEIKILYPEDLQYCKDYIKEKYNITYNKCETLYDKDSL